MSFASCLQNLSQSEVISQRPWPQGILYIRYKTVDVSKGRHSRQTGSQSPKVAQGASCQTLPEHNDAHNLPEVSITTMLTISQECQSITDYFNNARSPVYKAVGLTPFALAHTAFIFSVCDAWWYLLLSIHCRAYSLPKSTLNLSPWKQIFFFSKKKKTKNNESFSRASPLVLLFISILKYIKYYRSLTESMLEDQQIDLIPWAFQTWIFSVSYVPNFEIRWKFGSSENSAVKTHEHRQKFIKKKKKVLAGRLNVSTKPAWV